MICVSQNNKKLKIQKIPSIGLPIANDNKKNLLVAYSMPSVT